MRECCGHWSASSLDRQASSAKQNKKRLPSNPQQEGKRQGRNRPAQVVHTCGIGQRRHRQHMPETNPGRGTRNQRTGHPCTDEHWTAPQNHPQNRDGHRARRTHGPAVQVGVRLSGQTAWGIRIADALACTPAWIPKPMVCAQNLASVTSQSFNFNFSRREPPASPPLGPWCMQRCSRKLDLHPTHTRSGNGQRSAAGFYTTLLQLWD